MVCAASKSQLFSWAMKTLMPKCCSMCQGLLAVSHLELNDIPENDQVGGLIQSSEFIETDLSSTTDLGSCLPW